LETSGDVDVDEAQAMVEKLLRATNDHDLDALVACFAEDYVKRDAVASSPGLSGPRAGAPELGADLCLCPGPASRGATTLN
jgi:hypothetical protein